MPVFLDACSGSSLDHCTLKSSNESIIDVALFVIVLGVAAAISTFEVVFCRR